MLSVIIPIYNIEQYLPKCIESVINQTYKNLEIILVDDGSTDGCGDLCDHYSKIDKRVIVLHESNEGLVRARKRGLRKAQGKYIAFVDGDDYVDEMMYEKMYKKAELKDFDIVVCDLNYVYEDGSVKRVSSKIEHDTTNIKNVYINMYPCVWNKIYKKTLFENDIEFKKGVWFEDVDFLYKIFPYIKTIGVVKEPLNQYVQRTGSITKTFDKRLYDYIDNFNDLIKFYEKRNIYNTYKKELEYCYVRYLYATFIKQATHFTKEEFNKAVKVAIDNVKEHFPKYRKNKYFYRGIKGIYLVLFNKKIASILYKVENIKK